MQDKQPTKYGSSQLPAASNHRFAILQQQEEQTYKAFELQNFYQNKKLNLNKLKNQIEKFKSHHKNVTLKSHSKYANLIPINPKNNRKQTTGFVSQFQTPSEFNNDNYYNNKSFDAHYGSNNRNNYSREGNRQYEQKKSHNTTSYNYHKKLESIAVPHLKKNKAVFNDFNNQKFIQSKPTTPIVNNNTRNNFRQANPNLKGGKNKILDLERQKYIKSNFQTYNPKSNSNNPEISYSNNKVSNNRTYIRDEIKREKTQEQMQMVTKDKPKTYHFKIHPVTSVGAQSYQQQSKMKSRLSNERYLYNKNNRNTEKSVNGSQKQTQISSSHFRNQFNYNKKLKINSQQQLKRLETLICQLWNLYQLLITLMQHAIDFPFTQQANVQRYVKQVCSDKFQYIRTLLSIFNNKRLNKIIRLAKLLENISIIYLAIQLMKKKPIKQAHIVNFIGYCTSNIIFTIKILYLLHDIQIFPKNQTINNSRLEDSNKKQTSAKKQKSYSSLHYKQTINQRSNKNLIVKHNKIIKNRQSKQKNQNPILKDLIDEAPTIDKNQINNQMDSLNHQIAANQSLQEQSQKFQYSGDTKKILSIIRRFQIDSYKQELNSLLDVIIRMEHNCQIINIVQIKLCMQAQKDAQIVITDFLKDALRQEQAFNRRRYSEQQLYQNYTRTYYDSAHYIFQYLAYYIAKQQLYGIIPALQVAPSPYLNLKFPHTVIIQPYQVLVYQKNKNILIRAYSQFFIESLSKYCNIVFWSDMMPKQIDPILQLFPKKENIYTLYKYHCIYDEKTRTFVKHLDRVGGRIDNTIIIDRSQLNYANHRLNGFQFVWNGQKKDIKLQALYKILQPIFQKNHSLRKSLSQIRPQIVSLNVKNNRKIYNPKPFQHRHKFERIQDQEYTFQRNTNSNSRGQTYYNDFNNKSYQNHSRQYDRYQYQKQSMHENYDIKDRRGNNLNVYNNEKTGYNQEQDEERHMESPMQMAKQQIYNQNSYEQSNLSIFNR